MPFSEKGQPFFKNGMCDFHRQKEFSKRKAPLDLSEPCNRIGEAVRYKNQSRPIFLTDGSDWMGLFPTHFLFYSRLYIVKAVDVLKQYG